MPDDIPDAQDDESRRGLGDAMMESRPVRAAAERAKQFRRELVGEARGYAAAAADAGKRSAVRRADDVSAAIQAAVDELRSRDSRLADVIESAASRLDSMALRLEEQNVDELADEAAQFARRHPAMFIGGAVAIGFALGRAMKAKRADLYADPEFTTPESAL
jgi:hypothetical protein